MFKTFKNFTEFKKTLLHSDLYVCIPSLSRTKISKTSFMTNGKHSQVKENRFLRKLYKQYYGK